MRGVVTMALVACLLSVPGRPAMAAPVLVPVSDPGRGVSEGVIEDYQLPNPWQTSGYALGAAPERVSEFEHRSALQASLLMPLALASSGLTLLVLTSLRVPLPAHAQPAAYAYMLLWPLGFGTGYFTLGEASRGVMVGAGASAISALSLASITWLELEGMGAFLYYVFLALPLLALSYLAYGSWVTMDMKALVERRNRSLEREEEAL